MKYEKLLTALALVATTGIGLTALIAVLQTRFSHFTRSSGREVAAHPWRSVFTGLGVLLAWIGLANAVAQTGLKPVGGALGLVGLVLIAAGLLTASAALGRRVAEGLEVTPAPLLETWMGLWVLIGLLLVPFVGWIVIGLALLSGLGAALRTGLRGSGPAPSKPVMLDDDPSRLFTQP
ncbi:MAG: hypothetical protein ACYS22_14315 [Planctomycetota bacterium]|jgi:hypothetical protein